MKMFISVLYIIVKKRGKNKFLIVNTVDIAQIKYHKAIALVINNITGMRLMI